MLNKILLRALFAAAFLSPTLARAGENYGRCATEIASAQGYGTSIARVTRMEVDKEHHTITYTVQGKELVSTFSPANRLELPLAVLTRFAVNEGMVWFGSYSWHKGVWGYIFQDLGMGCQVVIYGRLDSAM